VRIVRDVRDVRVMRDVRVVAGFTRAEAEVAEVEAWRMKPAGWPGGNSRRPQPINATDHAGAANSSNTSAFRCC
jgi:hypothetical protein